MWDDTTNLRSSRNAEGFRLIDYEDGSDADDDLDDTLDSQRKQPKNKGKKPSKPKGANKTKKGANHGTMNGQGTGATTSQMTSVLSGSGHPPVDRFPSYSSDIEAGHVSYSLDGKALMNVETEENIKCMVSSSLFVAIIVLVFVMMFTFNPAE